jgi:hypothetical protein
MSFIPEKMNSIERALVAAATMAPPDARNVLRLICEGGMTTVQKAEPLTPGQIHYAKREKIIRRMKSSADRILDYAKHETLRNVERYHGDAVSTMHSAAGDNDKLAKRLAFDRSAFAEDFISALREESSVALGVAGQQLLDEVGAADPFKLPAKAATAFLDIRANLLVNAPDEIHAEVMNTIQQGLEHGETRKELMARISTAFDGIKQTRSETIANTETAAAFNFARDKAMRDAGVTHKKWLLSHSPLIKEHRLTHIETDGQTVALDEPFDVGGVLMMYPGDENAGPEDVINCHCVAIATESPKQ